MLRRKSTLAAKADTTLPDDLLEKLIPVPIAAAGVEAVLQKLRRAVIERTLGAELGLHLASPDRGRGSCSHESSDSPAHQWATVIPHQQHVTGSPTRGSYRGGTSRCVERCVHDRAMQPQPVF